MREKGKLQILSQVHGSAFEIVWDSRGRKAEGAEYRKGQRNRLEPGCVCPSPGSAVPMALCLLPWEVSAGSAGHRVQILLGSGALLLSLSCSLFYEVRSNMETNSQVTEGSLALDDAFADLEGSTHCSFPCPCPLMLPLAERGAASRGDFRGSWRCFKALREKLSSLYSNSKTKQLCSTGGAFKADCKPQNHDET